MKLCKAAIALSREDDLEASAAARTFEAARASPVAFGDASHQRKPESEAAVVALAAAGRAIERLEDALALRLGNTGAAILDTQHGPRAGACVHRGLDRRDG